MKIIINDGYENAKQLLYNEGLEDKREELNKFNFFKHVSNIPSQNYMHILYLIITICFFVVYVLSFATPGVFKQENLTFCRVSLILMCIVLFTENVRKAHSFRGGMDSTLFYNLMCMLSLILYTYYSIIYAWKIIIDIQIQQYL